MDIQKKRWGVLVACCAINLCLGSIYAWSVFAGGMADYLSALHGVTVTTGDLAIVYTIANAVGPITMISGGYVNDRIGPRLVILTGGLMFGLGMVASGFMTSVTGLIVTYGLIAGLGLGMAYGATISSCQKLFPDKRGLIGGITTAVYGMSSVILPPVVTMIVSASDATVAFKIIGAVFAIVIAVCSMFIIKAPEDTSAPAKGTKPSAVVNYDWKDMIKMPVFYCMLVMLTCGAFAGMMIISQASAVATNMVGMSAMAAASAVSILALFNALGRIVAGSISDKIGRINTLAGACALSVLGLVLLVMTKTGMMMTFYLGVICVGLSFGAFMGVFPGFTADEFGPKNNSVNYGIMFIGFALAGYFGPTLMRSIYAADGAYGRAFLIAIVFDIAGIVLSVLYRRFSRKA